MEAIRIATAQFEVRNADTEFNLAARRLELYRDILGAPHENPIIDPSWSLTK
ncbi:MAG: hypothetical protein ACI8P0_002176 [Planctomycetaceae bacterium]|jgi:hypothetical protein